MGGTRGVDEDEVSRWAACHAVMTRCETHILGLAEFAQFSREFAPVMILCPLVTTCNRDLRWLGVGVSECL